MGDMEGQAIGNWKGSLPANMESSAAFTARADKWWNDTILRYASSDRAEAKASEGPASVLVVSHGGLMHVMVQSLIERKKLKAAKGVKLGKFRFPNASVSVIEVDDNKKGTLAMFADTTHLNVELVEGNVDIVDE